MIPWEEDHTFIDEHGYQQYNCLTPMQRVEAERDKYLKVLKAIANPYRPQIAASRQSLAQEALPKGGKDGA